MFNKVNGVLLLDKPSTITSNRALQNVKRLFNTNSKVGHTGSLDPLATGMLPICFGEATKFSGFLLNADKRYLVTMQLGIKTDTGDVDGQIIATENNKFIGSESIVLQVIEKFIGDIWQTPPIYSAIKQNGIPLYKLARLAKKKAEQNNPLNCQLVPQVNIIPQPRQITIYSIRLINICTIKQQINLEVHCSKGTYIRSLVEDIGVALGCLATVANLRRIAIGNFVASAMVDLPTLITLKERSDVQGMLNLLLPVNICLSSLPVVEINQINSVLLQNGQGIKINNLSDKIKANTLICLIAENKELLGVGEVTIDNCIVAKRLVTRAQ